MTHIPISAAYWCENCQSVIDTPRACPSCTSTLSIIPMANWMDREPKIEIHSALGFDHDSRL